jgi:hypothetical protein
MRHVFATTLALALALATGCGKGSSSQTTGPTGSATAAATPEQAASHGKAVTATLRNRFLFDHNAAFNDGRTFRWAPPIPIYIVTGDSLVDEFLLEQFVAWEGALAGAGGTPFYAPQGVTRSIPRRGIFIAFGDLPGNVVGYGDPTAPPFAQTRRMTSPLARQLPRLTVPAAPRRLEIPELSAQSEIQRCQLILDPALLDMSDAVLKHVIRHEVGHCLGFVGHVGSTGSVMHASACCPLAVTGDVSGMMKQLYNLPPATEVTR